MLQRCINSPVGVFLLAALFGCGLEVLTWKGLAPLWQAAGWQTQVDRLDRWVVDLNLAGEDSLRLAFWVTGAASAVPAWLVAAFGGAVLGRAFRERWLLAASAGGLGLVITNEVLCWEMTWLLISWYGVGVMVPSWLFAAPSLPAMMLAAYIGASGGRGGQAAAVSEPGGAYRAGGVTVPPHRGQR